MTSIVSIEGEIPSTTLLNVFSILTDLHKYVPSTKKPIHGILSFLDTNSIGNLAKTCTTLATDISNSKVLQQDLHASYIYTTNLILRSIHVGQMDMISYECGCGVCRNCDSQDNYKENYDDSDYEEYNTTDKGYRNIEYYADSYEDINSVSNISDDEYEDNNNYINLHTIHLANFVGCNRCGCFSRLDNFGDRVCWCEACKDGCIYIKDHCYNCDCLEEYDAYTGEKVCFCESCLQTGCIHKVFNEKY
jgi:hypothetical protein